MDLLRTHRETKRNGVLTLHINKTKNVGVAHSSIQKKTNYSIWRNDHAKLTNTHQKHLSLFRVALTETETKINTRQFIID